jgi:lysophospholipase L1-like esterase
LKRFVGVLLSLGVALGACKGSSASDAAPPGGTPQEGGITTTKGRGDGGTVTPPVPTDPAVAYVGRFLVDGNNRTVSWPGSRIIARFDGTSVSATLDETVLYEGPSVFNVTLDGQTTKLTMKAGEHSYELGKDLAAGTHQVELYRRTEGQVGTTVFKGFDFGTGKLLPPPAPSARRVEILGDSSASGFGVECTDPSQDFTADTENFAKAWGAKIGEMVNADVIGTIYAGKGVVQNNDRSDPVTFPDIFLRTASESPTPLWDFTTLPVDVVVIMLGGNDYDQPTAGTNDEPDFATFEKGYAKLMATARQKYPKALLVSVLSPTQNDDYPVGFDARTNEKKAFEQAVNDRKASGDSAVLFVEVSRADDNTELTACEFHPNELLHTRIATTITAAIRQPLGW